MEKLKAIFGSEALTWEQLEEKLKDNKEIKLANLASGGFVDVQKYNDEVEKLKTANNTIAGLQETVKKFDGVDIEKLKNDVSEWQNKYNTDTEALKLDSAVNMALVEAKAKNPKLAKSALDMSLIKMDGDNLLGLTEQLDNLKKSDAYLFEEEKQELTGGSGARFFTGGNHSGNGGDADTFLNALMQGAGLNNQNKN